MSVELLPHAGRQAETDRASVPPSPVRSPVMSGHFARFNEWTHINSTFEGEFMERIAPGAFSKTFNENRSKMRVLFNHGRDPSLGDKVLGKIETLREDEQGAYYRVPLFDGVPDLIVDGLRKGTYGSSFRFKMIREELDQHPTRSSYNPDGLPERTIKEAKVLEFGPVTFPAYEGADAGIRSFPSLRCVLL